MAESNRDRDRKPLTTDDDSHALGTAGGAFAGGAAGGVAGAAIAGATVGSAAGPAGAAIGAAVGAVAGGLAGKAIAERIDPAAEDTYWRQNYTTRPYVATGSSYDDYGPAYRYGYERYPQYHGRTWDQVENDLQRDWEHAKGKSKLTWADAKHATKDAFYRVGDAMERAIPGDSDRDGR